MNTFDRMTEYEKYYKERIARARKASKGLPKGKLLITTNGKYGYRWRISHQDSQTKQTRIDYIKKKDEQFASNLAYRTYLDNIIEEDSRELKNIKRFKKNHVAEPHGFRGIKCPEEFQRLLSQHIGKFTNEWDEACEKWANETYQRYMGHQENLRVDTMCGIKVRSKSEKDIADLLTALHIPFRYEPLMKMNGEIYAPDFLIMNPITHELYIWEHFGAMDDPEYIERNRDKLYDYAMEGWIIDINLIVSTETYRHPFSADAAKEKLMQVFGFKVA